MRIIHISVALALITLASCSKQISLEPLSFDVKADSASYVAGSRATFLFSGKPDNITFYPGVPGRRFEFRDRTEAAGIAELRFNTTLNSGVQPNTLALMVSTDFPGGLTASSNPSLITGATWTDISARATWAGSSAITASGTVNLSDFAAAGKPVYIAFKYTAAAGSIQNRWTITNLSMRNALADGTSYVLDTLPVILMVNNYGVASNMPGWAAGTVANTYRWTLSATNMVIAGATTAAAATAPAEAWAITGPVNLKKVTPDAGITVQTMANMAGSFSYSYASPGNYQAVFVGSNANVDQQQSVERQLTINVQ
jgi:Domain of unknown function (DUF5017)